MRSCPWCHEKTHKRSLKCSTYSMFWNTATQICSSCSLLSGYGLFDSITTCSNASCKSTALRCKAAKGRQLSSSCRAFLELDLVFRLVKHAVSPRCCFKKVSRAEWHGRSRVHHLQLFCTGHADTRSLQVESSALVRSAATLRVQAADRLLTASMPSSPSRFLQSAGFA